MMKKNFIIETNKSDGTDLLIKSIFYIFTNLLLDGIGVKQRCRPENPLDRNYNAHEVKHFVKHLILKLKKYIEIN